MDSAECGCGPMAENYVVQWIIHGQLIDGYGFANKRVPGDEDIVSSKMAQKMESCGQVEIIGPESGVMAERVIGDESAKEIMKDLTEES